MADVVNVRLSGSDLDLSSPALLTLEIIGQHFLHRAFTEADLEELVRRFPSVFLGSDPQDVESSLLIVGQQVRNQAGGRADIVAIDGTGALVLVELKRDAAAAAQRYEPFEWQALRYAASYALFTNVEDLVQRLFAPYIMRHQTEFAAELGPLTAEELARRKLEGFLSANNALERFNQHQRIILVAGSFEPQVLSACAWLVQNHVDVTCIQVGVLQFGQQYFLTVDTLLPAKAPSDYFVDVVGIPPTLPAPGPGNVSLPTGLGGRDLPRIGDMLAAGVINRGDEIYFRLKPSEVARIEDGSYLRYQVDRIRYNDWGKQQSGWSAINIYDWFMHKKSNQPLRDLRIQWILQQQQAERQQDGGIDSLDVSLKAAAMTNDIPSVTDGSARLE